MSPQHLPPKGQLAPSDLPSGKLRDMARASRFRASFDTTARGLVTLSITVENDELNYKYRSAEDEGAIRESPLSAVLGKLGDGVVSELRDRGYQFPEDIPDPRIPDASDSPQWGGSS